MRKPALSLRREVLAPLDAGDLLAVQAGAAGAPTRDGICWTLQVTWHTFCLCT